MYYYDEIDLPRQYYKDASNKVDYQYDAAGNKWGKTSTISGTASTMGYCGQFIYQGSTLSKVLTTEGYYDPATNLYHYFLKDHLGNTRVTFYYSGSTAIVDQEAEYYPFGALFAQNNLDKNVYLYNGKELNNEFFENYDYGARFYDPTLGRWNTVDLVAEKSRRWSPYNYCVDNPMRFVDPDGMEINDPNDYFDIYTGQKIGTDQDPINNDIRLISKEEWAKKNGANSKVAVSGSISLKDANDTNNLWINKDKVYKGISNNYYEEAGYTLNELENSSISLNDDWSSVATTNDANQNKLLEINITPNKFGSKLNNKFDLVNLFVHERGFHGARFLKGEKWYGTPNQKQLWESEAYKGQMADPSWGKTSREFRRFIEENDKMYSKWKKQ